MVAVRDALRICSRGPCFGSLGRAAEAMTRGEVALLVGDEDLVTAEPHVTQLHGRAAADITSVATQSLPSREPLPMGAHALEIIRSLDLYSHIIPLSRPQPFTLPSPFPPSPFFPFSPAPSFPLRNSDRSTTDQIVSKYIR